jgi:hypothetical protein
MNVNKILSCFDKEQTGKHGEDKSQSNSEITLAFFSTD